jgi:hypothetical protein
MDIVNYQYLLDNSIVPQPVAQFPVTYCFQLIGQGFEYLRCQSGTSFIDLGKKCFAFSLIEDKSIIAGLMNKI